MSQPYGEERMPCEPWPEYAARMVARAHAAEHHAEHARLEAAELRAELAERPAG